MNRPAPFGHGIWLANVGCGLAGDAAAFAIDARTFVVARRLAADNHLGDANADVVARGVVERLLALDPFAAGRAACRARSSRPVGSCPRRRLRAIGPDLVVARGRARLASAAAHAHDAVHDAGRTGHGVRRLRDLLELRALGARTLLVGSHVQQRDRLRPRGTSAHIWIANRQSVRLGSPAQRYSTKCVPAGASIERLHRVLAALDGAPTPDLVADENPARRLCPAG